MKFSWAVAAAAMILIVAANAQPMRPLRLDKMGNPLPESATSFHCTKAKLQVERQICHDRILAMEDGSMAEQLWFMKRELTRQQWTNVIHGQRAWLQRRNSCPDSKCIETAYEKRSQELDTIWDARQRYLRKDLARVGQCENTTVEWVGPRLQVSVGDPPDGTSITFADAARQVSYYREPAVLASRAGDPARVCLIEIPKDCPPGDDRGRVYRAKNLRTGRTWQLPDSSHECGGA